jgi:release factor glutamine methyltransferase
MQQTIQFIRKELHDLYPPAEIEGIIRHILYELKGYTLTDLVLRSREAMNEQDRSGIEKIIGRLKRFEPVQYITGHTCFFGLKIGVNPYVLIPRPETEELVNWILSESDCQPSDILDIGTGSGCIALALKSHFKHASVTACDISRKAIFTARNNARNMQLDVRFFIADILNWESFNEWEKADIIVSNPPYVCENEKAGMGRNVLDYEPHDAIFVPDQQPLIYFSHIIDFSHRWIKPGGKLYFEINWRYASDIGNLMLASGFINIEMRVDLNGRPRFIRGQIL